MDCIQHIEPHQDLSFICQSYHDDKLTIHYWNYDKFCDQFTGYYPEIFTEDKPYIITTILGAIINDNKEKLLHTVTIEPTTMFTNPHDDDATFHDCLEHVNELVFQEFTELMRFTKNENTDTQLEGDPEDSLNLTGTS